MNRRLLLSLVLTLSAVPATAQQVEPEVFELENGMKFLLLPRSEQPNAISAGWVAKVGSVNERPGITGISHFFEHMMFKGTTTIGTSDATKDAKLSEEQHAVREKLRTLALSQQYERWRAGEIPDPWDPKHDTGEMKELRRKLKNLMGQQLEVTRKNEFDQIYTQYGGTRMNAFTSHDLTFYFIGVPSNKLELWAWMESDRLSDSVFREFYSERDVVHEERRMRTESTPTGVFQEQFESMFWQSSGYSWPVIGWPSDLNSYTYEQAQNYFQTYYRPNNLVGVIVGDFELEQAKQLITRYFGRLKQGPPPPPVITTEVRQRAEKRMIAEYDGNPRVEVRYHTVPFDHPDEAALEVLAEVLNGRTGRLYKDLVEGKEIATRARVRQDSRKYAGAFGFSGDCKGGASPAELEQAWYAHVEQLQREPVSAEELEKVKNRAQADSFRRLKDNFFLMIQLGLYEAMGSWDYINRAPKKLKAVTAADVQRVAKTYFKDENRTVAVYTRKAGTSAAPEDPELAKLDARGQQVAKQALQQLALVKDPAALEAQIQRIEGMVSSGQAPPEIQPALEYILAKARERLAELKKD